MPPRMPGSEEDFQYFHIDILAPYQIRKQIRNDRDKASKEAPDGRAERKVFK